MFCSPYLPNICNDIATLSCTSIETLKQISSFLKYMLKFSHKKFKCITFHSSSFPNFFLHSQSQHQLFHKSGHLFLIPHALSLCPILINHAKNCYLLPLSLQKECLNVHNILHKHVQKTCIILKPTPCSSSSYLLQLCLLKFKVKTNKNKK